VSATEVCQRRLSLADSRSAARRQRPRRPSSSSNPTSTSSSAGAPWPVTTAVTSWLADRAVCQAAAVCACSSQACCPSVAGRGPAGHDRTTTSHMSLAYSGSYPYRGPCRAARYCGSVAARLQRTSPCQDHRFVGRVDCRGLGKRPGRAKRDSTLGSSAIADRAGGEVLLPTWWRGLSVLVRRLRHCVLLRVARPRAQSRTFE
jgi:hypothetical protein